ncbi:MAG: hypothetical protein QG657_2323, partial [Acidobacteriota bacterium]|nr:hypothetical protein [Acidobacteriota bacterium]
ICGKKKRHVAQKLDSRHKKINEYETLNRYIYMYLIKTISIDFEANYG